MYFSWTLGMRAPRLLVGANRQFEMMTDQFFAYDSSITVPLGRKPVWPYTLHYLMPHKCSGNHQERRHCATYITLLGRYFRSVANRGTYEAKKGLVEKLLFSEVVLFYAVELTYFRFLGTR